MTDAPRALNRIFHAAIQARVEKAGGPDWGGWPPKEPEAAIGLGAATAKELYEAELAHASALFTLRMKWEDSTLPDEDRARLETLAAKHKSAFRGYIIEHSGSAEVFRVTRGVEAFRNIIEKVATELKRNAEARAR